MTPEKSIRAIATKAVQACFICGFSLALVGWAWPPALHLPQLWFVALIGILANVLQPSYRPFEGSRTPQDKGTARQILWSVYFTQFLALAELAYRRPVSMPLDWITVAAAFLIVLGLALRTWAVILLGRWFTWNVTVQPGQMLITNGPYRVIRHPSYTGAFSLFIGSCVLLGSYVAAPVASILLLIAFSRRIRHEESLMLSAFPEYRAYKATTSSLFPGI